MIFTRRFGALAARPIFPAYSDTEQENPLTVPATEVETSHEVPASAA